MSILVRRLRYLYLSRKNKGRTNKGTEKKSWTHEGTENKKSVTDVSWLLHTVHGSHLPESVWSRDPPLAQLVNRGIIKAHLWSCHCCDNSMHLSYAADNFTQVQGQVCGRSEDHHVQPRERSSINMLHNIKWLITLKDETNGLHRREPLWFSQTTPNSPCLSLLQRWYM